MLNALTGILDFCKMLADFVGNMVSSLFSLITMIPQAFTSLNYTIGYLPAELAVFAITGVTICIVLQLIGR